MVINHNISALNTYNKLSANENAASASLEKLSSGLRISKAADDAAGLAISQKMQAQINSLDQASSNAQDGISLIQTAEGGMSQVQSILQRMNELATESANGTQDGDNQTDRNSLDTEFQSLSKEIDRIANSTQFNGMNLLNGGLGGTLDPSTTNSSLLGVGSVRDVQINGLAEAAADTWTVAADGKSITNGAGAGAVTLTLSSNGGNLPTVAAGKSATLVYSNAAGQSVSLTVNDKFAAGDIENGTLKVNAASNSIDLQVGANNTANDREQLSIGDMRITNGTNTDLSALNGIDIKTQTNAESALDTVKTAVNSVSSQRAQLGAYQNRLNYTISNLSTESQNLQSASSQITDVDMAKEMTEYTKNNILTQAANAMLAQANQLPQSVLSLLKS